MTAETYAQAKALQDKIALLTELHSEVEAAYNLCNANPTGQLKITFSLGSDSVEIHPVSGIDAAARLNAQLADLLEERDAAQAAFEALS